MHRPSLTASCLLITTALAPSIQAQEALDATPIQGPIRNAGVYHVATGTWTRTSGSTASLGPNTIYNNTAVSSYFGLVGTVIATQPLSLIDEGRVPTFESGIDGDAPVLQDTYLVNGLEFAYCTDAAPGALDFVFRLYDTYSPCDLVLTFPTDPFHEAGEILAPSLPGSPLGQPTCWTITLDLEGSGNGFCMIGEGGPDTQGTKSFGLEWRLINAEGSNTGPVLAGDPDWTRTVVGADDWGGGGTFYAAETCAAGPTGLDTQDFFALDGTDDFGYIGCRFFGGYKNTNGCGGPSNTPFASFHTRIFAEEGEPVCDNPAIDVFCDPANDNSSGGPVVLQAIPTVGGAGYRLEASGGPTVPGLGFGFFVVSGSTTSGVQVGSGNLCLGSPQGRYNPTTGGAGNSLGLFDTSGDFENLAGTSSTGFGFDLPSALPTPPGGSITPGSTWHFQLWFRDMDPGATVNFSNGLSIQF